MVRAFRVRKCRRIMLLNTKNLCGYGLAASDGDVGSLEDFYFDDCHWVVRYVVARTGSWCSQRAVLLPPHSLGEFDLHGKVFRSTLDRKQIQDSQAIESHSTLSRQYEFEYYRDFGLPVYLSRDSVLAINDGAAGGVGAKRETETHPPHECREDRHLQSANAVTGFHIKALDGVAGRVNGLFLDDRSWSIPALVVETGHWYSGREILICTGNVDRISNEESTVYVNLNKDAIRRTLETDVARVAVGENGHDLFHD